MPKYAKRHYEDVAAIFASNKPSDHWDANKRVQHNLLLIAFVATFTSDNPRFDADRFSTAAGGYCP